MRATDLEGETVAVLGCGYLGAVHAACVAHWGHRVIGIEPDAAKADRLSEGHAPFVEAGLDELLGTYVASGALTFTTDPATIAECGIVFICVGTPQDATTGAADLGQVFAAIDAVELWARPGTLIVGKSTVPVGTASELAGRLAGRGLRLVWNPEFLREGTAVGDTLAPDRIVIGADVGEEATELVALYAPALAAGAELVMTDLATAELAKQAANAFLATKLSFINTVGELCETTGADVADLARVLGLDDRIGPKFLGAGIGFGGGCLPKDVRALAHRSEELGARRLAELLNVVDDANLDARRRALAAVVSVADPGARIAVLGASFKPGSDDVRDSPAVWLVEHLDEAGYGISWHDPALAGRCVGGRPVCSSVAESVRVADVLVVATDWPDYRELDPAALHSDATVVVDVRNCLDPQQWREAGWSYVSLGRR